MKLTRPFRTLTSLRAESTSRSLVKPYLESQGFKVLEDRRKKTGTAQEQILFATTSTGDRVGLSVRLCWRRDRGKEKQQTYSAAQLMARLSPGKGWVESIADKMTRRKNEGATHLLLVQPDGRRIALAAMIPIASVASIWARQRRVSALLIKSGGLGRRKKNHAENGKSPTLWLRDDKAPSVADVVWDAPGVINLVATQHSKAIQRLQADDTYDDLPEVDVALLGSEAPARYTSPKSKVKRDVRVRLAVLARANGRCERQSCRASRSFQGFLDVHHILGAARSDRVYNCVALCPNCHREAHYAADRDLKNARLLKYAARFR